MKPKETYSRIRPIGTLVYPLVEDWSLIDSLYFSTVTLSTVAYGDLAPKTVLGKILTIPYIASGIIIMSLLVIHMAQ